MADTDSSLNDADERSAMRAFLARCEVRLSTMHRVATALLSGAGILVLLPTLERDSLLQVIRSLLVGPITVSRGLLAASVIGAIGLALAMLWFVIIELTRFYFHANHIELADGEVFTPRFTLTGLRLASDELTAPTDEHYRQSHAAAPNVSLLVPANRFGRDRIDSQLDAYPGLVTRPVTDAARAEGLFQLAAARRRPLVEEVTKVEYGMVRHMLRLQVVVLRYVKALLVIVATSIAVLVCAAAANGLPTVSAAQQRWIAGAMLMWAPIVMFLVAAPVQWLASMLRSEGATPDAVRNDSELRRVETIAARSAVVVWIGAAAAMTTLLIHHHVTTQGRVASVAVLASSAVAVLFRLARGVS